MDFARKLPFARDRVVECYFWIVGVYFEPQYSLARKILTKVIAMTSIIDDIYDVYGTLEELELFTEAIDRFVAWKRLFSFWFLVKQIPSKRQMTVTERLHKLGCFIFRWDTESMDRLPDYMQICYEALLNVYSEIEEKVAKEGWSYRVHYGKEAVRTTLLNLSLNQIIIYYLVEISYSIYKLVMIFICAMYNR